MFILVFGARTNPKHLLGLQKLASTPADEKEDAERRVKMRTLGNIRLIAELFNKGIVAERIVTVCITELIGDLKADPIEDNVEVRQNFGILPETQPITPFLPLV